MTERFFKFRGRFDFSPHPYEIGNPISSNRKLEDNFFALKLYNLPEGEYKAFYDFHLSHYLLQNPDGKEAFFRKVNSSIQRRIAFYSVKDPFKNVYEIHSANLDKLEAFQGGYFRKNGRSFRFQSDSSFRFKLTPDYGAKWPFWLS